jgi:hypothetical protein
MKWLAMLGASDISLHKRSWLRPAQRYTKRPFVTVLFVALISTVCFADTEWTDYVTPGTQTGAQIPYQPLYRGAPGDTTAAPMCQNGTTLRTDSAWYRLCICYNGPCFITYYSIGTYECANGKRLWVVTARGKTDKQCGQAAVTATSTIFETLGGKDYGGYKPGGVNNSSFPSDSEVSKLIVDEGKRPDENSKKAAKEEKKEETKTTKEGGPDGGKTEKRPRKHVTKKSSRTHARRENETTRSGGEGISLGIGIGGFGGHGGDHRSYGDRGGSKN